MPMMVELCVNLSIIVRTFSPRAINQYGFRLVARVYTIQRLVEALPPTVPQTLPTLRGSPIPPEKDQGRTRILAETPRLP